MGKSNYILDLDCVTEEIFYFLESISDDGKGHECMVNDCASAGDAARRVTEKLVPFFTKKFNKVKKYLIRCKSCESVIGIVNGLEADINGNESYCLEEWLGDEKKSCMKCLEPIESINDLELDP